MLVLTWMSSNMADGNQQKHLLSSFAQYKPSRLESSRLVSSKHYIYRPGTLLEKLQNRYYSLRITEIPLLLTILAYHFFFHFLKLLQKLDRILLKISIPPGDI